MFVGAGTGPCWILMVGARKPGATLHYPPNDQAARYGASTSEATNDARVAYADWPHEATEMRLPWPPR